MNNALLAEIKASFQTQNLLPLRRSFFLHEDDGDFACPLVALALRRGQLELADPGIEIAALDAAAQTYGKEWTIGFLDGFDGQKQTNDDLNYVEGYALGLEAAQQLSPRDPPA